MEFRVENNKKKVEGKLLWKSGLRNLPRELVLSLEAAKDLKRFHSFVFLFFLVFALFSKSSFLDT